MLLNSIAVIEDILFQTSVTVFTSKENELILEVVEKGFEKALKGMFKWLLIVDSKLAGTTEDFIKSPRNICLDFSLLTTELWQNQRKRLFSANGITLWHGLTQEEPL